MDPFLETTDGQSTDGMRGFGDTYVMSNGGPARYEEPTLFTGQTPGGNVGRALIKFDVANLAGLNILSSKLRLYNTYSGTCTPLPVRAYPNTGSWSVPTVVWPGPTYSTSSTHATSATFSHGNSAAGCPEDKYVNIDATKMTRAWADGTLVHHRGLSLLVDETTPDARKWFAR